MLIYYWFIWPTCRVNLDKNKLNIILIIKNVFTSLKTFFCCCCFKCKKYGNWLWTFLDLVFPFLQKLQYLPWKQNGRRRHVIAFNVPIHNATWLSTILTKIVLDADWFLVLLWRALWIIDNWAVKAFKTQLLAPASGCTDKNSMTKEHKL